MTLVIIIVILGSLFGLAFATKRRFGVLGLALAAGVVLSQNATGYMADFLESYSLPVEPLSYRSAASVMLIILPALILLAGGPKYRSNKAAIVGSVGFSLLGTFFLVGPLTTALPTTDMNIRNVLTIISNWQNVIVVVALVLALLDTFVTHGAVGRRHNKASKH